ncbi:MAG: crotonase [Proteobacteria bacterium]|jgi:enoyl-CoA hydratase/carnithine racemase|nr:crotonase [Pseudomonadota bacterium]
MGLVEREDSGRVAVLFMNRPKARNALSSDLLEALSESFVEADKDDAIGAMVLTGRGRSFCSGGDLKGGMATGGGMLASHESRGRFAQLMAQIPSLSKPVVAALNGDALGGGMGLASACDMIVADPKARLGTPEIRVGLFPHVILAVLQRNVPRKLLLEMVLTGSKFSAERAAAIGLVNRVSEPGQVVEAATEMAGLVAAKSPAIVSLGKKGFYQIADMSFENALAFMNSQLTLNLLTEDAMVGIQAFMTRQEPQWKGR